MLGAGAVSADGGRVLDLDLRLCLAGLGPHQLLPGLHLDLGGAQQVRRGRLGLLGRRGRGGGRGVLDGRRAGERRRRRGRDGRGQRELRDRGRRRDHRHHGDDGDGDLLGLEGRERRGGGVVLRLAVSVIAPGDVVGSDWLRQRGHQLQVPRLRLLLDELFVLLLTNTITDVCRSGKR